MLAPDAILADRVTFRLRSIDRLYLNLYQPLLQTPGQLYRFLCTVRGHPLPSPALFGQMTRDLQARVERFAAEQGVPIVPFPRGADKEDIADAYFAKVPAREGIIFIGTAQERATSWWGKPLRDERGLDFAYARRTVAVKHYYFYLRDPRLPQVLQLRALRRAGLPQRPQLAEAAAPPPRHRLQRARQRAARMRRPGGRAAPRGPLGRRRH